jgi:hypothetical protein
VRDHFLATHDPKLVPTLSSGGDLEAMQVVYWREHLRPYLPPLSKERYQEMRAKLEEFDAGRIFRRAITMEYLMKLLGPHKKGLPTAPIAMTDPLNGELIPDGRWRESIGVQQMRSSVIIVAKTSPEQEHRLIAVVKEAAASPFNALSDNCSDFVARALTVVFGDAGLQMRPRTLRVADAWITTPIAVASDFVGFARRQKIPLRVELMPMLAGTRRPTAGITSISRGALVPDASQGKLAFSMKVYFNTLNPLLGLTAYGADKASRFMDLEDFIHERGSESLSRIANATMLEAKSDQAKQLQREQVRVFGAPSCWKAKQEQFGRIESQAAEMGLMSSVERSMMLKRGQPFLLPRLYERVGMMRGQQRILVTGMQDCAASGCGSNLISSFLSGRLNSDSDGVIPARADIRAMADSGVRSQEVLAFKVMTSVINYDLSSEPVTRRITEAFDPDWQLYIEVARRNGIHLDGEAGSELLAACSCREFDAGLVKVDAFRQDRSLRQRLLREGRGLFHGANR